jgi:hypothetical protein
MVRKDAANGSNATRSAIAHQWDYGARSPRENSPTATLAHDYLAGPAGDQQTLMAAHFAKLAEMLDAAGLGPADYLYSTLKWRLQNPQVSESSLLRSILKGCRVLFDLPPVPGHLAHAPILVASSYSVSANLLRGVVAELGPEEAILCDASDISTRSLSRRVLDAFGSLRALGSALSFAWRVRSILRAAETDVVESNRIAEAAFAHALHLRIARAILEKVRPTSLVIGNGNRPFELSLWAAAKKQGIATILLPYAEINLKPARFLSLCRGAFDLVLPFSDYSANQIRKLRADVAIKVVGFPTGCNAIQTDDVPKPKLPGARDVLYISGNNFEDEASEIVRQAFIECHDLNLRVRLHPRNRGSEIRKRFDWLAEDHFSDSLHTPLADDIANSDVVIMVRSTVALDALFAGVPVVWLSPDAYRDELERHPIRSQKLALLDASTPSELRTVIERLLNDEAERKRVVEEQGARLRAAGYNRNYYSAVTSALRHFVAAIGSTSSVVGQQ